MDFEQTAQMLSRKLGKPISAEQVEEKYNQFDFGAAKNNSKVRIKTYIWNGRSPINGTKAAQLNVPDGGKAYVVEVDGVVSIFQPFMPGVDGIVCMDDSAVDRHMKEAQEATEFSVVENERIKYIEESLA